MGKLNLDENAGTVTVQRMGQDIVLDPWELEPKTNVILQTHEALKETAPDEWAIKVYGDLQSLFADHGLPDLTQYQCEQVRQIIVEEAKRLADFTNAKRNSHDSTASTPSPSP